MLPHSSSRIDVIPVNGIKQAILIRGHEKRRPVLLHVHGGPGEPEGFCFIKEGLKKLEKLFTVCYWEQRGSGKSWHDNIPEKSMTLEQFIEDTAAVTRYLIKEFKQKKIYILGHSWGTMLASFTIRRYPDLYYSYIGIGQVANQLLSENESLAFIISAAEQRADAKNIAECRKLILPDKDASPEEWISYLSAERKFVAMYHGSLYRRNIREIMTEAMRHCDEYTDDEKNRYMNNIGLLFSMKHLWPVVINNNLTEKITEQAIPVFMFHGIHDYQTVHSVAKRYFEQLRAPKKNFYSFKSSAHFPHIEEYECFEAIIRNEVLSH